MFRQSLLTRFRAATLFALVSLLTGCGSADSATSASGGARNNDGTAGVDSNAGNDAQFITLAFAGDVTLPIHALSRHKLDIAVVPKNTYNVELALVGESVDASLNVSSITTDAHGKASIRLTAPTEPTTFRIRANVNDAITTEFEVKVVDATTGTLSVDRSYAGIRTPTNYVVSLFSGADCSETTLATTKPTQSFVTSVEKLPFVFADVPIGTSLAVQLEGDNLVKGCNVVNTSNGQQVFSTTVTLQDLPVRLSDENLEVALSTASNATILASELKTLATTLVSAYQNTGHDLIALLDQMQSVALAGIKSEFISTRTSSKWDETVSSDYASVGGETLLRKQLEEFFEPTIARLESDHAFELTLALSPSELQSPVVRIDRIAGLAPVACQVNSPVPLSRSLDAFDRLSWSTAIRYFPSALLDCAIDAHAAESVPLATSTAEALAARFDCPAFAENLDRHVTWTNSNSRTCAVDCLSNLCRTAIGIMYDRAQATVLSTQPVTLTLSATGTVALDADARPISTAGTWLGRYATDTNAQTVSGLFAPP